jgi:hypothetical protein
MKRHSTGDRNYLFLIIFLELFTRITSKKSFVICPPPFADSLQANTFSLYLTLSPIREKKHPATLSTLLKILTQKEFLQTGLLPGTLTDKTGITGSCL